MIQPLRSRKLYFYGFLRELKKFGFVPFFYQQTLMIITTVEELKDNLVAKKSPPYILSMGANAARHELANE